MAMSRIRKKKANISEPNNSKKRKTIDLGWKKGDEQIDSDEVEDEGDFGGNVSDHDDDEVEEEETLDAKKVRLAREYLRKLEKSDSDESSSSSSSSESDDEDGNEYDRIGVKLQRQRLKQEGSLERFVASKVDRSLKEIRQRLMDKRIGTAGETSAAEEEAKDWISSGNVKLLRGHDLTPTCVSIQASGEKAVSGSKDHSVILWDVENEKRDIILYDTWKRTQGTGSARTKGEVLSVSCSDDGRYAAVGRRDATISIFDIRTGKNSLVKTFTGHKGPVTSLSFRTQSLQLFSGSDDRCIRHHNLNEMMYIETLYGHQFGVTDVDCHRKERPVSVGRDRTARAWKLSEDTHLIFRGGAKLSSADCVSVVKDDWFLTGHDDGHLCLWMTDRKRAVASIDAAHGVVGSVGRGVCSIGSLKGSDLTLTGSYDGYLRLWKTNTGTTTESRGLDSLNDIPLLGFINGIAVGPRSRFCVVAVGQEPRLGRWHRIPKVKNRFGIIRLRNGSYPNCDEEEPIHTDEAEHSSDRDSSESDETK